LANDIEPPLGGDFSPFFGHEGDLVRRAIPGKGRNFRVNRHFQIERHLHGFPQNPHIPFLDMPPVFPQMNGNQIGPTQLGQGGPPHGIGLHGPPGLTQRGNMIDIHTQPRGMAIGSNP